VPEFDTAINFGEQRVITPHSDVLSGMNLGAALPYDDAPGSDYLAAIAFYAKPLRVGIAPVT
jgi:hypothetical protein